MEGMKDKVNTVSVKTVFRSLVCMAVGVLFGILIIPLGMIYAVICIIWEAADYLIKKTERN